MRAMQHLDLTEDEAAALFALLTRTVESDRYPLSPRIRTLKAILGKLRPEPMGEPSAAAPRLYGPPRPMASSRQRRGS
jgi:hypothetical protein